MRHAALLALALCAAGPATAQQRGVGAVEALGSCETDLRYLNQVIGWQLQWAESLGTLATQPVQAQTKALANWTNAAAGIRADIDGLRQGMTAGRTAHPAVVDRVLAQVKALQAQLADTPLVAEPGWRQLLEQELRPAVAAYIDFLGKVYRPRATSKSGLASMPGGDACFAQAVTSWTTLKLSPDELEATGRSLLQEARRDLAQAAGVSEAKLPQLLAELRRETSNTSREEVLAVTQAALQRAQQALPRWFNADQLPPIMVEPYPASIEAGAVAGAYRPATGDASAAYVVNLSRPGERRLMAEVIAFHETLPGHHLSFSLQKEAGRFNSGFVEGWAIYSEYLADEMKLYGTPRDRMGMHAKHLWAASRLIVEPGLHVRGWTRQQAIDFMRANTVLSDAEIAVEVDRYLAWPGQSLAYMLGADLIRHARARAERGLGPKFDVRAFHDIVLRKGPRPLAQVDKDVDAWIASLSKPVARSS